MTKSKSTRRKGYWGFKILALVVALSLELYFYSPDNSVSLRLPITIEIQNLPRNVVIVDPPNAEKGISGFMRIRGPRPLVEPLRGGRYKLGVSAPSKASSSEFTAVVDPSQLKLASGIKVLEIKPVSVKIRTERVAKKQLQVLVERVGELPKGYRLEGLDVVPKTVVARGPLSKVEGLQTLSTGAFDLGVLKASGKKEMVLIPPDPMVTLGVTIVSVGYSVSAIPGRKIFRDVQVKVLAPSGFAATVRPSRANVELAGPLVELEKLSPKTLTLIADGRLLREGQHEIPLTGKFEPGISLLSTSPATVKLRLVTTDG